MATFNNLFVCPESLVQPHFDAMVNLASILAVSDRNFFLRCDAAEKRCVVRDMDPTKEYFSQTKLPPSICNQCNSRFNQATDGLEATVLDYPVRLPPGVKIGMPNAQAISTALTGAALSLIKKNSGSCLSSEDHDLLTEWDQTIRDLYIATAIIVLENGIDRVFVHGQYVQSLAPFFAGKLHGAKCYIVDHPLLDRTYYNLYNFRAQLGLEQAISDRSEYESNKQCYLDDLGLEIVARHLRSLLTRGNPWVYSPSASGVNIREMFKLKSDITLISAFTSSPDELISSLNLSGAFELIDTSFTPYKPEFIYDNQIEWLQSINDLIDGRNDLACIVRVHPRMGRDQRSGIATADYDGLISAIGQMKNLILVESDSPLSSYDILCHSDVVTSVWSSMALEANYFGKPAIVAARKSPTYPNSGTNLKFSEDIPTYLSRLGNFAADKYESELETVVASWNFLAFSKKKWMGLNLLQSENETREVLNARVNFVLDQINTKGHSIPLKGDSMPDSVTSKYFIEVVLGKLSSLNHLDLYKRLEKLIAK